MMNFFICPNRNQNTTMKDFWTEEGKCTYCGSIQPDKFIEKIMEGKEILVDKVNHLMYTDDRVFSMEHCDDSQREIIKNFYETGMMKVSIRS